MPDAPRNPGFYVEEVPGHVRSIAGVATSVTAFIGRTLRGPVNRPVRIQSYADFERRFGGLWQESTLSYAVQHYFMNGGADAIIVRVFNDDGDAELTATYSLEGAPELVLAAASPGSWGDDLEVFVDHDVSDPSDATLFNITVNDVAGGEPRASEVFRDLSISPDSPRFVTTILEQQSGLVRVSGTVPNVRPALNTVIDGVPVPASRDRNGGDGAAVGFDQVAAPDLAGSRQGIWALEHADLFNLLCIPPFTRLRDVTRDTWTAAVTYCRTRRAMLIVDPPSDWITPDNVLDGTIGIDGTGSAVPARDANASLYFPRIRMADPLDENRLQTFAPCGVVAGIHARFDTRRGVWKAPAGQDATMVGVRELACRMTDGENARLSPLAVNALRTFPVTESVVWGARTMLGADRLASEWKYIPVRRLALFLEESLDRGTRWVTFEPNDPSLWSRIRLSVGAFMHDLFRLGAFQGRTPRDAYFVKCDTGTTTQNDIDRGIVNLSVGFAPLKPAEFLVIQISQSAGGVQT